MVSTVCEQASSDDREAEREVTMATVVLTAKRKQILDVIDEHLRAHGYPPSVREIGEAVGLTSSSTVHAHLATLQREGYLVRDQTKPRAIEVRYDPDSGATADRRPVRHVPLLGQVAAGTGVLAEEQVEEILPVPEDFTGPGELFMLRVRGDSMVDAGILDGDHVVVRRDADVPHTGDLVVAGIPGEEATVKRWSRTGNLVTLQPANDAAGYRPIELDTSEVRVYGKVVTVLRRITSKH